MMNTDTMNAKVQKLRRMAAEVFGSVFKTVCTAFKTLPEEAQHDLTFDAKPGGWVPRARLWGSLMRPVFPGFDQHPCN